MAKQKTKIRVSNQSKKRQFIFKWWMGLLLVLIIAVIGIIVIRLSDAAEPGKVSARYQGYDGTSNRHSFSQFIGGFETIPKKYLKIRDSIYGTDGTIPARCYYVEKTGAKNNNYAMTQINGSTCGVFWTNQPAFAWPMDLGRLTQCWGNNFLQGRNITSPSWAGGIHSGLDIGGPASVGTPVKAAGGGTVSLVQTTAQSGGYGNFVIINHNNGYWTAYAHMNSILVYQGQNVGTGHQLGGMGSTGSSTAAHLHFMVQNTGSVTNDSNVPSQNLNPLNFLPRSSNHDEGQCLRT